MYIHIYLLTRKRWWWDCGAAAERGASASPTISFMWEEPLPHYMATTQEFSNGPL